MLEELAGFDLAAEDAESLRTSGLAAERTDTGDDDDDDAEENERENAAKESWQQVACG